MIDNDKAVAGLVVKRALITSSTWVSSITSTHSIRTHLLNTRRYSSTILNDLVALTVYVHVTRRY